MKNTIIALLLLSPLLATAIDNYSQASIDFILTRQSETGEFDNLGVFVTAPAIAALQKYSYPVQIQKGANYIASEHHPNGCISTWCSGNGHIPDESGISLWALAETDNLRLLPANGEIAIAKIKEAQTQNGDFASDEGTSSEYTAWAIIALAATKTLTTGETQRAVSFLSTLQNQDGSINRTSQYEDGVNGPIAYYTALSTFALAYANDSVSEVPQKALEYLENKSKNCFSNSTNLLTIATSQLAFKAANKTIDLSDCIIRLQRPDGGFFDSIRSNKHSNSFDTAFAILALYKNEVQNSNDINHSSETRNVRISITVKNVTSNYSVKCTDGFDCISQIANVSCQWYDANGALGCNNNTKTCFINQINSSPQTNGPIWRIVLNGKNSEVGISCIAVKEGDEIGFVLEENFPDIFDKNGTIPGEYIMIGALALILIIAGVMIKK